MAEMNFFPGSSSCPAGVRRPAWTAAILLGCLAAGCGRSGEPGAVESTSAAEPQAGAAASTSPASADEMANPFAAVVPPATTGSTSPVATAAARPAAAPSGGAGDWHQFRGPRGDGSSSSKSLPVTWSQNEGIVWKTPLTGAGASSPVVWGDRIYLTSYTGYGVPGESGGSLDRLERHLLAFSRSDGKLLWDKAIAAKLPEEQSIRDHGYAANTPAADGERVYAFFGKSGVIAFDHQGEQLWTASVGTKTSGWGTAASPLLYKDLVIINASVESESLVALDKQTGNEKWRAGNIREAWNTPAIVESANGRSELIVATQGKILAFNPDSGAPLWSCNTDITWYMVPSPVAADGVIYYLGGRSGITSLAVRTGGSGDVTSSHRLWTSNKGSNVASPVYHEGHLYWMNDQQGIAYCADARSGNLLYEKRVERADQVYSSALLAAGRVYYLMRNGKTIVLAAKPQFEQLAANELRDGSQFNGSPAVAGDRLLIRSDRFLYCIGE
jgi:outer membrane protein assembly factor BamB